MKKVKAIVPHMQTVLISATTLLLLLIILAVTAVFILQTKWFLNWAESELTESIGQEVKIGSIQIDLGRVVQVRVEQASVANPSWASKPLLASLDVLEVGIDVIELAGGEWVFTEIYAAEPVIHLERSTDGIANWAMGDSSSAANNGHTSDDQKLGEAANLPRIESLLINDGRLTYTDPNQETSMSFLFTSDRVSMPENPSQTVEGGGKIFGQPILVELRAGPPSTQADTHTKNIPLNIWIESEETSLLIEGFIDAFLAPKMVDLQILLKGQNLSRWNKPLNIDLPALPVYQLSSHVRFADQVWSFQPVSFAVDNSKIAGSIKIRTDTDPLRIEGDFFSERLNVPKLQSYLPDKPESPLAEDLGNFLHILASLEWDAKLDYRVALIETENWPIKNGNFALTLKDNTLALQALTGSIAGIHLSVDGSISTTDKLAEGDMKLLFKTEQTPSTSMVADAQTLKNNDLIELPGKLEGELAVNFALNHFRPKEKDTLSLHDNADIYRAELNSFVLENFQARYVDSSSNTQITVELDEEKSGVSKLIKAEGRYRNHPMKLSLSLPKFKFLKDGNSDLESPQRLVLDLKVADATASVKAIFMPIWPLTHLDLHLNVDSASTTTGSLLGINASSLGNFSLNGSVVRRDNIWKIKSFKSMLGESEIYGKAVIDTADQGGFQGSLKSPNFDVNALIPLMSEDKEQQKSASSDNPSFNILESTSTERLIPEWLTNLKGQIRFNVEQLVLPNGSLKDISIVATMEAGKFRISPFSIELGGGTVTTLANFDLNAPSLAGDLRTEIQHINLDDALQSFGREAVKLGNLNGLIALRLPAEQEGTGNPLSTDALAKRLRIKEASLRYDDPELQGKANLSLTADSVTSGMNITGTVEYQDKPLNIFVSTGSLRQALRDYQSLEVDARVQIQETTISIDGAVNQFIPLKNFIANVIVEGPDPSLLGDYLGVSLPRLPPYRIQTRIHREQKPGNQQIFNFNKLTGTVGDSDFAGSLRVSIGGERPMIFARLHSDKIDFDELTELMETSPENNRLFSNKPINFTKLREMDADVEYRAKHIQANKIPLDYFELDMILEDGHLQMNRLDFGIAQGLVAMNFYVKANHFPVQAKLFTNFQQINLNQLLAPFEVADDTFGILGGRVNLWMEGGSLTEWLGSSDGGLYLLMTEGHVDAILVELAGLDFAESAVVFLNTDIKVPLECAYTEMQVRKGIATIKPFLIDTKDTKLKGMGTIDLGQERMEVTVKPYPKDFSLISSRGPLHVTGTFKNPEFGVDPSFPLPEFGTADDSPLCSGMMETLKKARKSDERHIYYEVEK